MFYRRRKGNWSSCAPFTCISFVVMTFGAQFDLFFHSQNITDGCDTGTNGMRISWLRIHTDSFIFDFSRIGNVELCAIRAQDRSSVHAFTSLATSSAAFICTTHIFTAL